MTSGIVPVVRLIMLTTSTTANNKRGKEKILVVDFRVWQTRKVKIRIAMSINGGLIVSMIVDLMTFVRDSLFRGK